MRRFLAFLLAATALHALANAPTLRVGEYACFGSGSRVLAGLRFKVLAGGRYTDLDNKEKGMFTVQGDKIAFRGGHLQEISGFALNGKGQFRVGKSAVCEPWS